MHHGDTVNILKDKILVGEKELTPIGILDQSRCWGRWVPDPRETKKDQYMSHLVVSPFEISSWPILFRITVVLEEKENSAGNLAAILAILEKENLNILTAEGTPAGHRHATINIIAEACKFKEGKYAEIFKKMKELPPDRYLNGSATLESYIHEKFIPEMLRYTWHIKKQIYEANKGNIDGVKHSFLRDTFVPENNKDDPEEIVYRNDDLDEDKKKEPRRIGLIYDPSKLHSALKGENSKIALDLKEREKQILSAGDRQFMKAVSCTWLQNHAYYWLYGRDEPREKILHFDSRHSALKPDSSWIEEYAEMVSQKEGKFPFNSISTINYNEQYIRILFSEYDKHQRTRKVKIPYRATFPHGGDTKGLLHAFCNAFHEKNISLRSVFISTEARDAVHECGTFTFLATDSDKISSNLSEKDATIVFDSRIEAAIKNGHDAAKNNFNALIEAKKKLVQEKPDKNLDDKNVVDEYERLAELVAKEFEEYRDKKNDSTKKESDAAKEKAADASILATPGRLVFEESRIIPFQSKILFLSTKFDWLTEERPNLLGKLQKKAEEFGFDVFMAHSNFQGDKDKVDGFELKSHLKHLFVPGKSLTPSIIRGLHNSNAFLQIIPQGALDSSIKGTGLEWLLFEYGGAQAIGLPCAICVDTSGSTNKGGWSERLKIQSHQAIFEFSTRVSDSVIANSVAVALEVLAEQKSFLPVNQGIRIHGVED